MVEGQRREKAAGGGDLPVPGPADSACLPAAPGSYVLELVLTQELAFEAGRLGRMRLGPGRVRYYGSARGPGGVRARVRRHLSPRGRPSHWHVDALTARVRPTGVFVSLEASECELVARDLASGRWRAPLPGFGSSDCRICPAHLLIEVARVTSASTS